MSDGFSLPFSAPGPELNLPAARAERDAAVELVGENASSDFKELAYLALCSVAHEHDDFIVDAVWEKMGEEVPATRDRRAMGAVMQRAAKEGLIKATDGFRASAQRQCHANPRRVWKSLI